MPIRISIPKGRSCYYLRGTVTVGRRSRRVYETTGIRVGKAGSRALAEEVRLTREVQIRDELLHGTALTRTWLDLAVTYCEKRQKKRIEKDPSLEDHPDPEAGYVLRLTNFFSSRGMADVPLGELEEKVLNDFFTEALKDRKLSYKARHRDTYRTMMNLAQRLKWVGGEFPLPDLPRYDIAKEPVGKSLEDEDVRLFVMLAPKYARAYVASVFSTGLRGGELLFLKRTRPDYTDRLGTGLCLDQGNEHFFLGTTKDGAPILRALSDDLVMLLKSYLDSRPDKHNALFLTHRGAPYRRPRRQRGALCKKMWKTLAERVARTLEARAVEQESFGQLDVAARLRDRATQCRKVTGHWGRHNMVSKGVQLGLSDREIMQLTGHRSTRMLSRYTHFKEDTRKKLANSVGFSVAMPQANQQQPLNRKRGKSA